MEYQEIEIKLYVKNLGTIAEFLQRNEAQVLQPRTHEINLRFDTEKGELTASGRVLRLRKNRNNLLTYKGPSQVNNGARIRTEIQTEVADFDAAKAILEALGYRVSLIYEKYRAEYEWHDTHISLDEMPYGTCVEIEGQDAVQIHRVCTELGLDWERRVPWSYAEIFSRICVKEQINPQELTFAVFQNRQIVLEEYGILPAQL